MFYLKGKIDTNKLIYFMFSLPALLLYSFFYIYSVICGIYYSMTDWNGIDISYNLIGLDNFRRLLTDERFWNSLSITVYYAAALVVIVISAALAMALILDSLVRFKTFFKSIFFFPAMLSSVTVALIWDQLFFRAIPVIGKGLGIGLLSQSPLASTKTALNAVILVNSWQAIALPIVIFVAGLQTIPKEIYEASSIDGANSFQRFRYITLPYLIPTLTVNFVLTLKSGLTVFDYVYAMTNGGPAKATEIISVLIYKHGFQEMRFALANAEAVILFIIIATLSYIQIKISGKGGVVSE